MNPLQKHKAVKNAAILAKCFVSGVWNNTDFVSKQFERVGTVFSSHLKSAGYTSFARIASANPRELEMCLNKQPPFGNHLRKSAIHMPEYALDLEQGPDSKENILNTIIALQMAFKRCTVFLILLNV